MEITYYGMNCVRLTGKDIAVLCDPPSKASGISEIKLSNEATLLSSALVADLPLKPGMVLDGPGEYEIKGAMITGVPAQLHIDTSEQPKRGTIYSVTIEGVRIGFLGNVAPKLSGAEVEALGQIDVLIIPVGGHGLTLDAQGAAEIVSQLEPKYVVPVHYDDDKTKYEAPQDKLDHFLKEIGSSSEPAPKLRVTTRDLPVETTVAVLQRQG